MEVQKKKFVERRKGPDPLVKAIRWVAVAGWILFIIFCFVIDEARPPMENFIDRFLKVQLRKSWDQDILQYCFYIMITILFICIAGFIMNLRRLRRKTDRFSVSIILLGIFSIIGIIVYLTKA